MSNTLQTPKLRVVFLGTPDFSVPTLKALLKAFEYFEIVGVITQPDKPAGRGQQLTPPPVKVLAEAVGLPLFQPKSIKKDIDLQNWLREQKPDFFVTVAFGQILSQDVLDIPRLGTVNVHASLLPEYRGANPIQQAVLDGKTETGVTTMLTDIGVDTGDMLLKDAVPIGENETCGSLFNRLSELGGPLLIRTLKEFASGDLKPTAQDHDASTHAPKTTKEAGFIDWEQPAQVLHNRIRAMNPWPSAVTGFRGERVKLHESRLVLEPIEASKKPGDIIAVLKDGLRVQTGDGALDIVTLQAPGKKAMSASDWARGAVKSDDACFEPVTLNV